MKSLYKTLLIGASGFSLILNFSAIKAAQKQKQYNVLFLMTDEHSPHAIGCYGNKIVHTPNMDALAKVGIRFTNATVQNPVCVPSRASLISGKIPSEIGVFTNANNRTQNTNLLPDVLISAGYNAAWYGKQHWGGNTSFETINKEINAEFIKRRPEGAKEPDRLPQNAIVASWSENAEKEYITMEYAIGFLEKNNPEKTGKPFFLGVSFVKPHFPFFTQQKYYDIYNDIVDIPAKTTAAELDAQPKVSKGIRESDGLDLLTPEQIRKARATYYGMITYVDGLFGKIIEKLKEEGLAESTIIVYTSDHGEMAGEHGLWYKSSFHEASVEVPQIWSFPKELGFGKNQESKAPVMMIDIFPTLCDLCGLKKPEGLEGKSMLQIFNHTNNGLDRVAISEIYRGASSCRMARTVDWKYCYYNKDMEQLFDLKNDLDERVNQIHNPKYSEILKTLKEQAFKNWEFVDGAPIIKGKKKNSEEE